MGLRNFYRSKGLSLLWSSPQLAVNILMRNLCDWVRHCPLCQNSWGIFHWLCASCERDFFLRVRPQTRMIGNHIVHNYLIDWRPGDKFTPVVHSLKGGGHRHAVHQLVRYCTHPDPGSPIFFVLGHPKDHGWELATAFSTIYGGQLHGLKRLTSKKQALLSRKARSKRRFKPVRPGLKKALFVDDIVTTGATVQAAYRALGQPSKMTVWSLFYRNHL